ncbi:Protein kinase-like domain [Trinorchestia longiramus]|nr:Protein kinase-like domain [Trinorchestia longiramus]
MKSSTECDVDLIEVYESLTVDEESEAMRSRAYQVCRDYLLGAWKLINQDEMVLRRISGGLSNHLYYCALPAPCKPVSAEPREVLLRIYGQMHGEDALENMLAESVIFTLLSERKLGPRLYGVFPGGRLEQYIPARSLLREELWDANLERQIATKIARVHALDIPISKEATWLWTSIEKWLRSTADLLRDSKKDKIMIDELRNFDGQAEMEYVRDLCSQVNSPVVFAHNDLQEGNILLQKSKSSRKVALIDFEYCAYNYRGFDLANHFCERMYGYRLESPPFFTVHTEDYPSDEEQLNFIRPYLAAYYAAKEQPLPSEIPDEPIRSCNNRIQNWLSEATTVEAKILKEIKVMKLAGHLFWTLWCIVQGHVSSITFGYLEYGKVRMDHYRLDKAELEDAINKANTRSS